MFEDGEAENTIRLSLLGDSEILREEDFYLGIQRHLIVEMVKPVTFTECLARRSRGRKKESGVSADAQ